MGKVRVNIWKEDGVLNHTKLRVKNIFTLEYDGGARQFLVQKSVWGRQVNLSLAVIDSSGYTNL